MREKFIISSATVDRHGDYIPLEILQKSLNKLNGHKKMRYLVNHRRDIPPIGYFDNGEIQEINKIHHLLMEPIVFQNRISISWDSNLLSEDGGKIISLIKKETNTLFQISFDKNNFLSDFILNKTEQKLKEINEGEIILEKNFRKSFIPDPQIILTLASFYSFLKPLLSKIGEKFAEDIADDVYRFSKSNYQKLIKKIISSVSVLRRDMIPKHKVLHTIFEIPGTPDVELHIKSDDINKIEKALKPSKLKKVYKKIEIIQLQLNISEIHFIFSNKDNWDFSYLITEEGKVIGTKESFRKRDKLFERIELSPNKAFSIGADGIKFERRST